MASKRRRQEAKRQQSSLRQLLKECDEEWERLSQPGPNGEIPVVKWPSLGDDISAAELDAEMAMYEAAEANSDGGISSNVFFANTTEPRDILKDAKSDHENTLPGNGSNDLEDVTVGRQTDYSCLENMSLEQCLKHWATLTHQPPVSVNMILAILTKKLKLDLPKDARTLLKTPTPNGSQIIHQLTEKHSER